MVEILIEPPGQAVIPFIAHWQPQTSPLQTFTPQSPPEHVPPTAQDPLPLQVPGRQVPVEQRVSLCPAGVGAQRASDPHCMHVPH